MVVGGGTGLAVVLRGLKSHVGETLGQLTGVVTVTDDGGSSGRLRRDFGVLPPGDIRNCIVALSEDEDLLARLFQYRFPKGEGLAGHSFGNLFLAALTGVTGDFYQAILTAEAILSVRGRILPATLTDLRLRGRGQSGKTYEGESAVGQCGEPLRELSLVPGSPAAFAPAVEALEEADLILLGPGSLYTSILPNLLIPGVQGAIRRSGAPVALLLNLMTQPGETDGMSAVDHVAAIQRFAPKVELSAVIAHEGELPEARLRAYAEVGSKPIPIDRPALESLGVKVTTADLLAPGDLIRHDSERLALAALSLLAPEAPFDDRPFLGGNAPFENDGSASGPSPGAAALGGR